MKAPLDGTPGGETRGRVRVHIVCSTCEAVIGMALESDWGQWLNTYDKVGKDPSQYRTSRGRSEAPIFANGRRLEGPGDQPQLAWCDKDSIERPVSVALVLEAMERARAKGKIVRMPA